MKKLTKEEKKSRKEFKDYVMKKSALVDVEDQLIDRKKLFKHSKDELLNFILDLEELVLLHGAEDYCRNFPKITHTLKQSKKDLKLNHLLDSVDTMLIKFNNRIHSLQSELDDSAISMFLNRDKLLSDLRLGITATKVDKSDYKRVKKPSKSKIPSRYLRYSDWDVLMKNKNKNNNGDKE